jgi:hypothetical protein
MGSMVWSSIRQGSCVLIDPPTALLTPAIMGLTVDAFWVLILLQQDTSKKIKVRAYRSVLVRTAAVRSYFLNDLLSVR